MKAVPIGAMLMVIGAGAHADPLGRCGVDETDKLAYVIDRIQTISAYRDDAPPGEAMFMETYSSNREDRFSFAFRYLGLDQPLEPHCVFLVSHTRRQPHVSFLGYLYKLGDAGESSAVLEAARNPWSHWSDSQEYVRYEVIKAPPHDEPSMAALGTIADQCHQEWRCRDEQFRDPARICWAKHYRCFMARLDTARQDLPDSQVASPNVGAPSEAPLEQDWPDRRERPEESETGQTPGPPSPPADGGPGDEEHYLAVATSPPAGTSITPGESGYYGIGWHTESHHDAGVTAEAECRKQGGGSVCSFNASGTSLRGGCVGLAMAEWRDRDEDPERTYVVASSSFPSLIARDLRSGCRSTALSGKHTGTVVEHSCEIVDITCAGDIVPAAVTPLQ